MYTVVLCGLSAGKSKTFTFEFEFVIYILNKDFKRKNSDIFAFFVVD